MAWAVLALCNFAFLIVALTSLGASYERFTWWGFTSFTLYSCIHAIFGPDALKGVDIFFATVSLIIMFGVVAMAAINDNTSMLAQVVKDEGLVVYFVGTFLVHYLPVAVILSTCTEVKQLNRLEAKQISLALSLFCLYLLYENPQSIYGVPVGQTLAAGGALALGIVAVFLLWRLET